MEEAKVKVQKCTVEFREFETRMRLYDEKFKQMRSEIDDSNSQIALNDRYLSLIQPINIMNQIVDTLHATLEGRQFNSLIRYERQKYEELESAIRHNLVPD